MDILISEQDDQVNAIEATAVNVEQDMSAGLAATGKAVNSARAARKKRKICFIIIVITILVIAAIVAAVVCTKSDTACGRNGGSSGSGGTQQRRALALGGGQEYGDRLELWSRAQMGRAFGVEQ